MAYLRKRRSYSKKGSSKKRSYKKKGVTKAVKKYVKRTIHRDIENKLAIFDSGNKNLYEGTAAIDTNNPTASTPGNLITLSPRISWLNITQGTDRYSRIGNKIRVMKASASFTFESNNYNAGTNVSPRPQYIRCFLFYDRLNPDTAPTPAANQDFFYSSTGVQGFTYRIADLNKMVNTDRYKVFKEFRFKVGFAEYDGTGSSGDGQFFSNNDFKFCVAKTFSYTKYLDKLQKYNGNSATPSNHGLWMLIYTMAADGSVGQGAYEVQTNFQLRLWYEDS